MRAQRNTALLGLGLAFALVALAVAPTGSAQERSAIDVGTRTARLSQRVMSPFCPGKTLYDCPSGSATDMRLQMASWMDEGLSEDAVVERLREQMPGFDFTPPAVTSGLFWGAWSLVTLVLLLAVFRLVRRTGPDVVHASRETDENGDGDDEYERRLDDALKRVSG